MKKQNSKRIKNTSFIKFNINYFLAYLLLILLFGGFLIPKIAFLSSINEENIINLTNKERINLGIQPLTVNQLLTKAAIEKGKSIMKTQTFQHNIQKRKFSSWIKDAEYEYMFVGENLALDFVTSEGAVKAWLDSPSHRKNLLNDKFRETGVAVLEGDFHNNNSILIVQIFGTQVQPTAIITPVAGVQEINNTASNLNEYNLKPVTYQPNIFQKYIDMIYNKESLIIIILNLLTTFVLIIGYIIHQKSLHKI